MHFCKGNAILCSHEENYHQVCVPGRKPQAPAQGYLQLSEYICILVHNKNCLKFNKEMSTHLTHVVLQPIYWCTDLSVIALQSRKLVDKYNYNLGVKYPLLELPCMPSIYTPLCYWSNPSGRCRQSKCLCVCKCVYEMAGSSILIIGRKLHRFLQI